MRPRMVLASMLLVLAACSGGPADDTGEGVAAATGDALAPIKGSELAAPLSKRLVEGTHTMPSALFETKWSASLSDSPLMFLRAYPAAFHLDLKQLPLGRIPGDTGVCVGDAHPDNFGYLAVDSGRTRKTVYAFNDLDDSGTCPIALDALRYFVSFRLYFDDGSKLKDSIEGYVDEALGSGSRSPAETAVRKVDGKGEPRWSDVVKDALSKYTKGDAFRALGADELTTVDAATKESVKQALAAARETAAARVLDVAQRPRDGGGSGGLTRYWAFVELGGERTILELKESATPGVEFGHASRHVEGAARLTSLRSTLWDVTTPGDYFYATIGRKTFLVRDRTRKASVDDPKSEHRAAQAAYLGALHRGKWQGAKRDDVRDWLDGSSKVLAKRWEEFFAGEKKKKQ